MLGGILIAGIAAMSKPAVAILGGGQVALFGFGPASLPVFLVLSPFSLPFQFEHPATAPGPIIFWVFTVGLVALNGLAAFELRRAFRLWSLYHPLQALAIEPLSREGLMAYDAQASQYDHWEAAGIDEDDDEDWWEEDEEGDEEAEEDWAEATPSESRAVGVPMPFAPRPPPPAERALLVGAPAASPPARRGPALEIPESLPRPTTGAPFLRILFSADFTRSLGLGGVGLLIAAAGVGRQLAGLSLEVYGALAVLAILLALVARNLAIIEHFHSQLPRGAALPLSWRGVPVDLAIRSLVRDWWCVVPALVLLGLLLGLRPLYLALIGAMIAEAQVFMYLLLRLREEAGGGRRWPSTVIKFGLGVPFIFYLLTAILVFIDNFENAAPDIQGAYWLGCLLGYETYALLLTVTVLWASTLRRDATILGAMR